ncbi:Rossmann fold nucleotide-binding protein Smf [Desulfurella amilsii]|uniref:Rossmann fold nucleotide-binding protein Smf n=1 Tax=Desulfurella amilsii TaxID=1562698 RepID=A0A1X4XWF0_9BACT|nr:Rossmann fold nucleotide-binding protein Smf [Desulfurella amilsii]
MQRSEILAALSNSNIMVKDLKNFSCVEELYKKSNIKIDPKKIDADLAYIEKNGITIIGYFDENYPKNLKNIDYPPIVLFAKGHFDPSKLFFSIVGTRYPSGYGEKCAQLFSKELALANFSIVSGLARGIDSIAHRSCLQNGGYSVGVLGCGIDIVYPRENRALFELMIQNGAIISEFAISTPPSAYNFPRRNRIITGLSEGLLVVEADIKSGSLISAKYALTQSKPVFSIPGEIFSKRSYGTNQLIKDGAYFTQEPSDIIFYFYKEIKKVLNKESNNQKELVLTDKEACILDVLEGEMSLDEIAEKINFSIDEVVSIMFDLEVKGVIKRLDFDRVRKL